MIQSGSQVLPESENVDLSSAHVAHCLPKFLVGLAKPEHQTRLREHTRLKRFGMSEYLQCLLIACTRIANRMRQAPDRLHVLGEHIKAAGDNGLDVFKTPLEIWCERLDGSVGVQF